MKLTAVTVGLLCLVVIVFYIKETRHSNKIGVLEDQISLEKAAQDSIKHEINKKTGEWEFSKQTYAATNDQLTNFLTQRDKELADLKKSKSATVGVITKTIVRVDTIVENIPGPDSIRTAAIYTPHYKADIVSWPRRTSLGLSVMDTVKYSIDKEYRLVAQHTNPFLKVTELNSFYVKPEVKRKNWKYLVGGLVVGGVIYGITK